MAVLAGLPGALTSRDQAVIRSGEFSLLDG
jgi:hypothetical protein